MLTRCRIRGDRRFGELRLDDLARINLIVGDNGVGKMELLRDISLMVGVADECPGIYNTKPRKGNRTVLEWERTARGAGKWLTAWVSSIRLEYEGNIDARLLTAGTDLGRADDDLLAVMRTVEPGLLSVRLPPADPYFRWDTIECDIGRDDPVWLDHMGTGARLAACLVLAIVDVPGGVVLCHGIASTIHHRRLPAFWQALADAVAAYDVQLFATTHSLECVAAAHRACGDDLRVHRIEAVDGDRTAVVTYDAERLAHALEYNIDIR